MKKHLGYGFAIVFLLLLTLIQAQTTPAFPGAEGFGRYTTGGRGGQVYYVTSLADDGSQGTLRWAIDQSTTRTILFSVSGTIQLNSGLKISKGNVTIAGQSAPGDGICIAGFPVFTEADNIIIRYVRCRMGDEHEENGDGADAMGGRKKKNIIIDHCSISWSTDECASFYENENFTMQWCIISESLRLSTHSKGAHGYGGIWGGSMASFHHNLMAHHDSRTPRFGPGVTTQLKEQVDMRNNVIYNWSGYGCYGGEGMKINIVNNFYKPGPATPTGERRGRIFGADKKIDLSSGDDFYPINDVWGKYFVDGNKVDASTSAGDDAEVCDDATNDNWTYGIYNQIASKYNASLIDYAEMRVDAAHSKGIVTTHTPDNAYTKVLLYAGCSLVRDDIDNRIVDETTNGIAQFKGESANKPGIIDTPMDLKPDGASLSWTPWPTLSTTSVPVDTDEDGIPDEWEDANGLDKNEATDRNLFTLSSVYTNLEVYLNSLVEDITKDQNEGGVFSTIKSVSKNDLIVDIYQDKMSKVCHIITGFKMSRIKVYAIDGKIIQSDLVNFPSFAFDYSTLQKGISIILIEGENGEVISRKLVLL